MKKILFPGTFDPFTIGHLAIVKRALCHFDEVIIAIGQNSEKRAAFPLKERLADISKVFENEPHVSVLAYNGLTVDFAKQMETSLILRGVRNVADFEYERSVADANRRLFGIETVFMIADAEFAHISSSLVRELLTYGKDVETLISASR